MKGSLQIYDELIAGGCTDAQARAQANQLDEVSKSVSVLNSILIKIEKDLFWMQIIGGAMTAAFMSIWFK